MVLNRMRNIAFLSTYPPRECGIATFTQDLVRELDKIKLLQKPKIIALSNDHYKYDSDRVKMEINQYNREDYIKAAKDINNSNIELLVIEHEYGIFGGECGEYLLDFVNNLNIPFVTTLHTVLPKPSFKQREILNILGKKSRKIITMAKNTVDILENIYHIDKDKIAVIHHGVPFKIMPSREKLKAKQGLKDKKIISTFGLIGPSKGLEYGIEAIAEVAKKHSDVVYLILGQTHPCIKREKGEEYREKLEKLVKNLKLEDNVWLINKYLTKDEIINYLQISDIYMTPYLGKDQAVSGTLAYAAGYGRVIVSTPYIYAKEMLAEGRGMLGEFKNAHSLAKCINYIMENPDEKKKMEHKTLKLGKTMMWQSVAKQYAKLFITVIEENKKEGSLVI